jgi:hypothetical protein
VKTGNGLNVPGGYGSGGSLKGASRPARRATRTGPKRTQAAGEIQPGMTLRGQKTLDTYEVLATTPGDGLVTLTVLNTRTKELRHWSRRSNFQMELA